MADDFNARLVQIQFDLGAQVPGSNAFLVQIQEAVRTVKLMTAAGLCRELADKADDVPEPEGEGGPTGVSPAAMQLRELADAIDQAALERYGLLSSDLNETPLDDQWTVPAAPPERQVAPSYPGPNEACLRGAHNYGAADARGYHTCLVCGFINVTGI